MDISFENLYVDIGAEWVNTGLTVVFLDHASPI